MRPCSYRTSAVNSQMNGFIMERRETIMCQELGGNKGVIFMPMSPVFLTLCEL